MLGMNRNTLRAKLVKYKLRLTAMAAPVAQALLSVSDKIGPRRVRQGPGGARRRAPVHRRHREGAGRRRPRRSPTSARYTGFPGNAGRPREDAAPEGARRHPRAPRRARARRRAGARTASRRSTSSSSTSTRSARRSRSPAARSRTRSRTSTSAARRWCARRRRTGRTSASSSTRPTTPAVLAELDGDGGALGRRHALPADAQGLRAHGGLRRRHRQLADRARRRRRGARAGPIRSTSPATRCRSCATARTRTSRPRSIATRRRRRARIATLPRSCRARSCRTTTSPTATPRGSA